MYVLTLTSRAFFHLPFLYKSQRSRRWRINLGGPSTDRRRRRTEEEEEEEEEMPEPRDALTRGAAEDDGRRHVDGHRLSLRCTPCGLSSAMPLSDRFPLGAVLRAQRAAYLMGVGLTLILFFSDPMVDVMSNTGARLACLPSTVSFILAPLASNASELIASLNYAAKKTQKTITVSLAALEGAACMNNTFCLAIFMALIFFKSLAWKFSAETLTISHRGGAGSVYCDVRHAEGVPRVARADALPALARLCRDARGERLRLERREHSQLCVYVEGELST